MGTLWGLQGSPEAAGWLPGAADVRGLTQPVLQKEGSVPHCWRWLPGALEVELYHLWVRNWVGWDSGCVSHWEEMEGNLTRPQKSVVSQPEHGVQ